MTAWDITRKDLRLLTRDRRALAVLVILPLVFIFILGTSTGKLMGWKQSNHQLPVGIIRIANNEGTDKAVARLAKLSFLNITELESDADAQQHIEDKKLLAVITIGPQFSDKVGELTPRDILNTKSGRLANGLEGIDVSLETANAGGSAASLIRYVVTNEFFRSLAPDVLRRVGMFRKIMDAEKSEDVQKKVDDITQMTANDARNSSRVYSALVPSYTVMFVFFLVNIMGRSFIAERELGTLRRLQLAPARPVSIMLGKTLPFLVISLAQTAILFLFGRMIFGMSWGNQPWLLFPIIIATSLAATSLGLCFSTMVRTDSQVSAYGNLIVLTMAGISGCFMPRDWLPETMQTISLATPHAWALMAYNDALGEATNIGNVLGYCAVLLLFAVVFFLVGWNRFTKAD